MRASAGLRTSENDQTAALGEGFMMGTFLDPGDNRWRDFLRGVRHDVYHLPGYVALAARCEGGRPIAFHASDGEDAMLVPLLLRRVPQGLCRGDELWDAVSPYGYASPLFTRPDSSEVCRRLMETFIGAACDQGLVTLFLRMHPLLDGPLQVLSGMGTLVEHGNTVSIDLRQSPDELSRDMSTNHRRGIRKLCKAGFHAVLDVWEYLPDFVRIYRQTMARVGAEVFYFFKESYFEDLRTFLEAHLHLCCVLSPDGKVAAAGLFTLVDGILEYHLGGSRDDYLDFAPSKIMFAFMRNWGQRQGERLFHLGGGLGGRNDSLFAFKAGFSSRLTPFHTFRLVLNQNLYSSLCASWEKRSGMPMFGIDFFPAYRKIEKTDT